MRDGLEAGVEEVLLCCRGHVLAENNDRLYDQCRARHGNRVRREERRRGQEEVTERYGRTVWHNLVWRRYDGHVIWYLEGTYLL